MNGGDERLGLWWRRGRNEGQRYGVERSVVPARAAEDAALRMIMVCVGRDFIAVDRAAVDDTVAGIDHARR